MGRGRFGRITQRSGDRRRARVLCVALAGVLIAQGFAAAAQTAGGPADRPVIREPARSAPPGVGDRLPLHEVQFMPGMPGMQGMGPMMTPQQGGTQGSMGGGMAMVMTGDTIAEMMAGACTAGLFIGGVAAVAATGPAAPVAAGAVLSSAGIGCGFAMAATAAGMAGMMGARALTGLVQ
jgi:hypothetical protein